MSVAFLIVGPWQYCVCCIKIRCNPMYPLNGALPGPDVLMRVTCGALVAQRFMYAPPRCRTSQYSRTFRLLTMYSMVWDWPVSRALPMLFYWPKLLYPYYSLHMQYNSGPHI